MAQFSMWSRDSSRIAFQWDLMVPKDFREEIRIVSVGGDTPDAVIPVPGGGWFEPRDWSPDGTRIIGDTEGRQGHLGRLLGVAGRTIDKARLPPRPGWSTGSPQTECGSLFRPGDGKPVRTTSSCTT